MHWSPIRANTRAPHRSGEGHPAASLFCRLHCVGTIRHAFAVGFRLGARRLASMAMSSLTQTFVRAPFHLSLDPPRRSYGSHGAVAPGPPRPTRWVTPALATSLSEVADASAEANQDRREGSHEQPLVQRQVGGGLPRHGCWVEQLPGPCGGSLTTLGLL